ncbi:MAG TPA: flagellar basal body P-ring protein FlgI [Gemmatimonas aurantiaca]|uniref:Flagellar P-ring protein n=2 Tax=Gemmatimonas aurantiaca TaxID=173480 RepID=C1A534_GEMAT|nr:flagellar basal body P-ring protein FlgI [Gemmatimonas aurantiaca]BAH37344.1 flagellar P-ring protein precursor [Gemmatimonas aurantiaca T-27]HCT55760.1 flagellar basal body P-ring protein FlgI [Gemmatimonas aurantiaca]
MIHINARILGAVALALVVVAPSAVLAQNDIKIRDLTAQEGAMPVRLVGYGLAVGLDGTGDRAIGGQTAGPTVQGVINTLRRFNIEVPADLIRMRNVAAVLVTAEVSPFLRAGGRFEIHVSSMGDARSLRGGVLYMTPLVADANGPALASAQGALLVSDGGAVQRYTPTHETTARIPSGGVLEADLPRPAIAAVSRLLLREPDLGMATKIAAAINGSMGEKTALVEDEGAVIITLADSGSKPLAMAKIRELAIAPESRPRLVIDGRDGTVVAGGDMVVGSATVSHGAITLAIGKVADNDTAAIPGSVRLPAGIPVQRVATALHAVQTPVNEIAAIFAALREVGAITAEVIVR